jgi:SAM-dependent methyltransferase
MTHDDILRIVEQHWDREVERGCGYTVPALELTPEMVTTFAAGRIETLPGIDDTMEPRWFLAGAPGKDILCLASGGGQQSAVFGLLGARVTSLDLSEGQLRGDRTAAEHYGYQVRAVRGDACDLSVFEGASFDLVYTPGLSWVPDVRAVHREVYRVLRPGGLYRVSVGNPAVHTVDFEGGGAGWDGVGYRIVDRYKGGPVLRNAAGVENMDEGEPTGDHRHLYRDSVGGLLDVGFHLRYFAEDPSSLLGQVTGEPGSWEHCSAFIGGGVDVVAEKPRSEESKSRGVEEAEGSGASTLPSRAARPRRR